MPGSTVTLTAKVSPKKAKNRQVTWSTSNSAVATVSSSGKVKVVGYGTAKVTARTANGKTAVSIAASVFGKYYSPVTIHTGKASKFYSERYAVAKLGGSTSLYGKAAISVRTASQILTDIGIQNQPVYTFTTESAVSQIREHLKQGKPVIAKVNNKNVNGIRIANSHHAIVLIAVDDDDYVTFIDPVGAQVNYAHACGKTCRLKLEELVGSHMDSATGNYSASYMTSLKSAGGYILVG